MSWESMEVAQARASKEGGEAFRRGLPRSANPYATESPLHDVWNSGWTQAKREGELAAAH